MKAVILSDFNMSKTVKMELLKTWSTKTPCGGEDIVQLKGNHIPRGLIPLEKLFDQNDVTKNPKMKLVDDAFEDKNIGTEENPKIIKLSKSFPVKEKEYYINLMKRYTKFFSWSYEYIKDYDTSII